MSDAIPLVPRLDLAAASALHEQLLAVSGQDVTLDASEVSYFGSICVQVLLVAARTAKEAGHALTLTNVTERAQGQLAAMGLTPKMIEEGV